MKSNEALLIQRKNEFKFKRIEKERGKYDAFVAMDARENGSAL